MQLRGRYEAENLLVKPSLAKPRAMVSLHYFSKISVWFLLSILHLLNISKKDFPRRRISPDGFILQMISFISNAPTLREGTFTLFDVTIFPSAILYSAGSK